jgi:iron complex outermembrane receptor protein
MQALRKSTLYVMGVLALSSQAFADEENIFFSEMPIIASVSRLPQRLADAPTAVTVLDRDIIKATGARDLNDVLRLVPGFQTYPNNTDAARVTYHGLADEAFSPRVQVLIDGRSQYSPLFRNGVNWATLPVAIEDIERIEVVRGSNSVSYGSNAFLGVINIITVDPSVARRASASVNHGNQGVRDYTLQGAEKIGDIGHFRLTYQQKDDNGLTDQFDWKDSFRSRLFNMRADFNLTQHDTVEMSAGFVKARMQRGRLAKNDKDQLTGGWNPEDPFRFFYQSSAFMQGLWRHVISADSDFQLRYAYTEDQASEDYQYLKNGLLYNKDDFGDKGRRHEIEAVHKFPASDSLRISWGAGYRWDSMTSEEFFYKEKTVNREVARLFGNFEWRPADWFTGNAGLSGEADSLAADRVSPRVSGNFHITPQNTIRVGYARSYRTGSPVDYRADQWITPVAYANGSPYPKEGTYKRKFYGNPNMPSERLDSTEIGYLGDWKAYRASLDVRLFQEKIPNRMFVMERTLSDPALCIVNTIGGVCTNNGAAADFTVPTHSVDIRGIEYQFRWQPFDGTRFLLSQTFTKTRAENLESVWPDTEITTLRDKTRREEYLQLSEKASPSHSSALMLMQKLPYRFDFSLAGYFVGDMKWTRHTAVNSYKRIDARLGHTFRMGAHEGEIAYTIQSLNGDHGEFKASGDPADRIVERRHWATLRIGF